VTATLRRVCLLQGTLRICTPLHIASGIRESRAFTVSRKTVKRLADGVPYIPGSTLKGVMRAEVERACDLTKHGHGEPLTIATANSARWPAGSREVLQLFGCRPSGVSEWDAAVGPPRCSFHHAEPTRDWLSTSNRTGTPLTHQIDTGTIGSGMGEEARMMELEVVPPEATFTFRLVWREYEGDDTLGVLLHGLRCLERHGLGFGVNQGFGRIRFDTLTMDGEVIDLPGNPPSQTKDTL
jgi:CRISPR-associated protein Csm3